MVVTVLLVDDAEDARLMLADHLRRLTDVKLIAAVRDEREAADVLRTSQPDLLLVDLHSHHWDGDDLGYCARLRELTTAPLVVITSFLTNERWQRLKAAGVEDCLLKQLGSQRLERELVAIAMRAKGGGPLTFEGPEQKP
jgi:CheY-like chemotaxis protein